jgi:hypothetical protein
VIAWLQLPAMILIMTLLYFTLSLCVILLYATCRDAEVSSAVFPTVFRRCVISPQEGIFISLIALLSIFLLLSEGVSSSVALT